MITERQTCFVKQRHYRYTAKLTTMVLLFMLAFQATDAEARRRSGGSSYPSSSTYTMPSTPAYKPTPVITPTPHRPPSLEFIPTPTKTTPAKAEPVSSPALGGSIPSSTDLAPLARPVLLPVANPITTATSNASSNRWLMGTAGSIGFGGFLWLLFLRRREPSPPSDPLDQLLEKINQQWNSYSMQQKKTIQELKSAHTKEFLSRDDLKIQLEKVL